MAPKPEPDSLAFRFAVVLALAVIVLTVTTLAASLEPANDSAAPIPPSEAAYHLTTAF
jgi:hypothetical protein